MSRQPFSMRWTRWIAVVALMAATARAAELGVSGDRFTIDGTPAFLFGISYYGALGASREFITRDLDDLRKLGFNWIRVWANWSAFDNDVSAVDSEGRARRPYLDRLVWLAGECDRRGMIVDVTLSRGNGAVGPPRLQSLEAHRRAVETLVSALKSRRNWYLDLANERNVKDKRFVSFEELKELREVAKRIDYRLLITASHAGGEMGLEDLRSYLTTARVEFISPHRPRHRQSPTQTEEVTRKLLAWMKEISRVIPIHYQEIFRRGYTKGWEPLTEDFAADLRGAWRGGAAGWCFHNGAQGRDPDTPLRRSFDMRESRLFDQLDEEEKKAIRELSKLVREMARPRHGAAAHAGNRPVIKRHRTRI